MSSKTKTDSEHLGERLRYLRTSKTNMSQSQIARLLYLDRSTYSNYELGRIQPTIRIIKELAKLYEISIDSLLDYESSDSNHKS